MQSDKKLFDELVKHVRIDRNALDDEVTQFPEIFYQVCDRTRRAEDAVNELRIARNDVEAELQEKARDVLTGKPGRVTNAMVNAWVKQRARYKTADKEYQDAKAAHGQWGALKEAMQAKSYKLRDLVDLFIAQYYSDPAPDGDGSNQRRRRAIRAASSKRG